MRPDTAKSEFESFVAQQGSKIAELRPSRGLHLMIEFYRQVRAEGVLELEEDGDTLLYEWGTFDWGNGNYFQVGMTRQFVDAALEGDDAISQLRLIFRFPPTEDLIRLKHGDRWCDQPKWLSEFETYVWGSEVQDALSTAMPEAVDLVYTRI